MDVRCERCRAQYVFDDEQITPSGLTVQCTNCGHLFRVKKKELVVTVAVKPGELDQPPVPATAAARTPAPRDPSAAPPAPRELRLRRASGEVVVFHELSTLQRWIVERRAGREDELAGGPLGDDGWRRLGALPDLAPFFQVVDAAERGRPATEPMFPAVPAQASSPAARVPPPPSGFPPPSFAQPRPGPPPPPAQPTLVLPAPPEPEVHEVTPALPEPVPSRAAAAAPAPPARPARRGPRLVFVLALLAVAAGAAVYVFAPGLLPRLPGEALAPAELMERAAAPAAGDATPTATTAPTAAPTAAPAPTPTATPIATEAPTPTDASAPTTTESIPPPVVAAAPDAPSPAPSPSTDAAAPPPSPGPATPAAAPAPAAPKGPKALLAEADRLRGRGDCKRALDLYGRLVTRDPEHAAALSGRGLCYLDAEEYGPAEVSFKAALAAEPASADALLGLAETLRWQGRTAEAITYYEKYLAAHPDGEDAPVARNALDTLRR